MREFHPEDNILFCLSDIKRSFWHAKSVLWKIALGFGCFGLFFALNEDVRYPAEAVFKESGNSERASSVKEMLLGGGASAAGLSTITVMKSRKVLKPVIQKLGLQVSVQEETNLHKNFRRIQEGFLIEFGKPIKEKKFFHFSSVVYEGDKGKSLFLRFLHPDEFEVLNEKKEIVAQGKLHQSVSFLDVTLTLEEIPKNIRIGRLYPMSIAFWVSAADGLGKRLNISTLKSGPNFFTLQLLDREPQVACCILNSVMESYQEYLKKENERIALQQLTYLEKRKKDFQDRFGETLGEQVAYIGQNLGTKGYFGLEDEVANFAQLYQKHEEQILLIDLEMERIKRGEKNKGAGSLEGDSSLQELNFLKGDRDAIEMALIVQSKKTNPLKGKKEPLFVGGENFSQAVQDWDKKEIALTGIIEEEDGIKQLEEIRRNKQEGEKILHSLEMGSNVHVQNISYDPDNIIHTWAEKVSQCSSEDSQDHQKKTGDFARYLRHYIHLLSVKEKFLEENQLCMQKLPFEFDGMNLEMIKGLQNEYNGKLEQANVEIRQLAYLVEQSKGPNFDMSTISMNVPDSFIQGIMHRTAEITFCLHDERNYTSKEKERFREELELQKSFFASHVQEMISMKKLEIEWMEEKLNSIHKATLGSINQKISLLEEQDVDQTSKKLCNLQKEKILLLKKLEELRYQMKDLPEKWKFEKELKLKETLTSSMMQAMTQLVEANTVQSNLQKVESIPWDYAFPSASPKSLKIFFFVFLFAFVASFFSFLTIFIKNILRGFPLSFDSLQAIEQKICGYLSSHIGHMDIDKIPSQDLETLRKMASFLEEERVNGQIVGFFGSGKMDFSVPLTQLLAKREKKVLLISIDSSEGCDSTDWASKIQKKEWGDFLSMGGKALFVRDAVVTSGFRDFLVSSKNLYDEVILFGGDLTLGEEVLGYCDKVCLLVRKETLMDVKTFLKEKKSKIAFVLAT